MNPFGSVLHFAQSVQKSKVSTAEMLFGMQLRDTGLKRYPIRVRPRVIQYAITLVLRHNDQQFLGSLRDKLTQMYPLYQAEQQQRLQRPAVETIDAFNAEAPAPATASIMYVYYPGEFNWLEFTPLAVAFVMLFAYVYFSIRKIDEIRSRAVLATCAVITIFCSLMMSLGLCFFFDLTTRMQSKGVFQYLIILLGLENVLVITKSVISTDHTFDVKIRVAQGLSREGWTISKTLLTEITILTIGLATFVPVIQEFCVFAIVGLISDFFLQMMLFSTVLAMDIKRVDVGDLRRRSPATTADNHSRRMPFRTSTITPSMTINRSRSHPKLSALDAGRMTGAAGGGAGLVSAAGNACGGGGLRAGASAGNGIGRLGVNGVAGASGRKGAKLGGSEIPKRLRIVNFWARTRFFQRAFMLWMIVWIGSIIYNTRVLEQLFVLDASDAENGTAQVPYALRQNESADARVASEQQQQQEHPADLPFVRQPPQNDDRNRHAEDANLATTLSPGAQTEGPFNITEQMSRLRHPEYDTHYYLSNFHWSSILRQYNVSLSGRYVAVLPPIKLSHAISVEEAHLLRNPNERPSQPFQWKALAVALDPIDFSDLDIDGGVEGDTAGSPVHEHDGTARTGGGGTGGIESSGGSEPAGQQPGQRRNQRPPPPLHGSTPLIPKSPMEIFMVAILCAISVSVLTYTMVVFYRCICTRNYAEWRSSWTDTDRIPNAEQRNGRRQRILEGVPILVRGHTHRIECLVTDGQVVASSCLDGQVKMWDANNGELIASIDRSRYFQMSRQMVETEMQRTRSLDGNSALRQPPPQEMFYGAVPVVEPQQHQPGQQIAPTPSSPLETPGSRCAWSPIWCLDYLDNLIVIGCADGRLEFWEASTGNLKCVHENEPRGQQKGGVTHVHLAGNRVVAMRLSGRVDFLRLESYTQGRHIDWGFTAAYRRSEWHFVVECDAI